MKEIKMSVADISNIMTPEQIDAITHAWLDLCAIKEHFDAPDEFVGIGADELKAACEGSIEELEQEFPFLLEGVEDE
jgi:hypothetical protein